MPLDGGGAPPDNERAIPGSEAGQCLYLPTTAKTLVTTKEARCCEVCRGATCPGPLCGSWLKRTLVPVDSITLG